MNGSFSLFLALLFLTLTAGCDRALQPERPVEHPVYPRIRLCRSLAIDSIVRLEAQVRGDNIAGTRIFPLNWDPLNRTYNGSISIPAKGNNWELTVKAFDANDTLLGEGKKLFDSRASSLVVFVWRPGAVPIVDAGPDTLVRAGTPFRVRGHASGFGQTVSWAWDSGATGNFSRPARDTACLAPAAFQGPLPMVLRVTDELGDTAFDTITIWVRDSRRAMKPISGGYYIKTYGIIGYDSTETESVTVSSFLMDSTEVTQQEYRLLSDTNPSAFQGQPYSLTMHRAAFKPVESASWYEAILYCNRRSRLEGRDTVYTYSKRYDSLFYYGTTNERLFLKDLSAHFDRKGYRLPTLAEWTFACRGGGPSELYFSYDSVNGFACVERSDGPAAVASFLPNGYGLYDMIGNVAEWCWDWAGFRGSGQKLNPTGPASGNDKALSMEVAWWTPVPFDANLQARAGYHPMVSTNWIGFRTVLQE